VAVEGCDDEESTAPFSPYNHSTLLFSFVGSITEELFSSTK